MNVPHRGISRRAAGRADVVWGDESPVRNRPRSLAPAEPWSAGPRSPAAAHNRGGAIWRETGSGRQQILDLNRQLADARTGGATDRIANGGGGPHTGELASPR